MASLPDTNLRPKTWSEYVGQEQLKGNLDVIIKAARKRGEPLEHLLFYGNSGLGKTTMAHVIANETGAKVTTCAGPQLERVGDIASLLTNLEEGSILFLDECHRIHKSVTEMLYSAMEDYTLHLVIGKGPMARTMDIQLPRFTLIGATTKLQLLSSPFRNRFGATFQFNFYELQHIEQILERSSGILAVQLDPVARRQIAERSRLTPRVANRLLKRVRDFATIKGSSIITPEITEHAFAFLGIDKLGLEKGDRKILSTIVTRFRGGPVGAQSLAAACSEEEEAVLEVYEPFLIQQGLIERTQRGRVATPSAYRHLGLKLPNPELI
ncbi:MAG: Holliday junction branch migration DNA helicase RuvB [bacterium]|nr:Holliday junction branch migration DNA helicase RuvB [bacterium]MDZ4231662.1 Holliday junction branch migration DNA helicase RuvB [Candidatus Pacearchaeota archaeon]